MIEAVQVFWSPAGATMPSLGARAFEVHLCNYWPEWGIKLLKELGGFSPMVETSNASTGTVLDSAARAADLRARE